jgi:hypothetical protein
MKTIAIEEHFKIPDIIEANSGGAQERAFKLFGSNGSLGWGSAPIKRRVASISSYRDCR